MISDRAIFSAAGRFIRHFGDAAAIAAKTRSCRDRGYIDRRNKLRGHPYIVEVPHPEGGRWREPDDINA